MGRAMLIICAGVLISLGIIGMSTADMGLLLTQNTTTYANDVSAKNAAHTGIQMAMQEISDDTLFAGNRGPDNKWKINLDDSDDDSIYVYVEYLNDDYADNEYWQSDSIRIVSEGIINSKSPIVSRHTSKVSSVYLMAKFSDLVPPFEGGLTNLSDNVNVNDVKGSASISGTAPSDANCEGDKPAITVTSEEDSTEYANATGDAEMDGSENINVDSSLTYQPTDELIERLSNSPDAQTLPEGTYKDSLGTADDPGVFFVENSTKLSGQTTGYGIMVVRTDGDLGYEGELDLKGTFDFHGLVIFENAYALDAKGTPTIHGSMLIGNTADYDGPALDIDIGGNVGVQYDCRGENYAKKAAANLTKQNKYTRVVSFEETGY